MTMIAETPAAVRRVRITELVSFALVRFGAVREGPWTRKT